MSSDVDKPDWWVKNEKYRQQYDLPEYNPPIFVDGEYTHEVIEELEKKFDSTIQIRGQNTAYPDKLEVRINSCTAFLVDRHRTENGNTVYELSSTEFQQKVRENQNPNG
jgi:hypothetical protein